MIRSRLLWVVCATLSFAGGCSYCASPYDYCGPVDYYGTQIGFNDRVASILQGEYIGPPSEMVPAPVVPPNQPLNPATPPTPGAGSPLTDPPKEPRGARRLTRPTQVQRVSRTMAR